MKPEVREHLDRAEEFLRAAELLMGNGLNAIALGRAYYAIFHAATAALMERGIERGSHHGILAAFGQFLVKLGHVPKRLQSYFRDAFDARGDSDYSPSPSVGAEQVRTHIERAREFVQICRDLCEQEG